MATHELVTIGSQAKGQVELDPAVFEAPVRPHLFHAEVRRQLAARQRGTHSTKNRSAVSGGGSKPWRQKGTGRARQGSTRSPQWQGGGAVFGPVPRTHDHRLPKKMRRAALRGALSLRRREGDLIVVADFRLAEIKTREAVAALEQLGVDSKTSVLIVVAAQDPVLERSVRNLPRAQVIPVPGLNTYDVLRHHKLVVTEDALAAIHARLGDGAAGAAS